MSVFISQKNAYFENIKRIKINRVLPVETGNTSSGKNLKTLHLKLNHKK